MKYLTLEKFDHKQKEKDEVVVDEYKASFVSEEKRYKLVLKAGSRSEIEKITGTTKVGEEIGIEIQESPQSRLDEVE